jgi:hypothetical protein
VKPTIYLAFVDDWELRGDGSGDIVQLQFSPMRTLVEIYNRHGIHGSFNAEVMQQLTFRKFQDEHAELGALADRWDTQVQETFRQGHDIQLHIHPQWFDARYEDGEWRLMSDWSILNHDPRLAFGMMLDGKRYLEKLLRPMISASSPECTLTRGTFSWIIGTAKNPLFLITRSWTTRAECQTSEKVLSVYRRIVFADRATIF